MQTLIQTSKAYRLVKTERQENRLSHTYLLLYDDARNLRFALKEFAKIFFFDENLFQKEWELFRLSYLSRTREKIESGRRGKNLRRECFNTR